MNDHVDLDNRLDEALRQLETPRAPRTLLPRVMAAVHTAARVPWYRREWRRWPVGWQVASAMATALFLALTMNLWPPGRLTTWALENTSALESTARMTRYVEVAVAASEVVWRTVGEPVVPMLVALAMLMGVKCVLLGLTLNHVAFRRSHQP
jgi:hypothetical protein